MAIFVTERQVAELLDMATAVEAVEEMMKLHGEGRAFNHTRQRVRRQGVILHWMAAAVPQWGLTGFKVYTPRSVLFFLYGSEGEILMVAEAAKLGQIRTGAASGVATKFMARKNSSIVGIIGTGFQAETQLEAICQVRQIAQVFAYSRNNERREQFARKMTEQLRVPVEAVSSAEEAVRKADIVVTVTTSHTPVLLGSWLKVGTHINAVGSNSLVRRELDSEAVKKCQRIVVDSREQAKIECGDLLSAVERGDWAWDRLPELGEVVCGKVKGRENDDEITLFESQGIALWDLAVGKVVYERAKNIGIGESLPF
ncbi:MAG: ornithine cyclodeaminase family protein [Armatimonadetes bacterium]|nr:ornithine cyclodeaminase family protein [Armatimonadota bacterium]MDW8027027.1 ornithine cyclodeaminase family protein [Armatimonadota bacterium]